MSETIVRIASGDYEKGGLASKALKEQLKQIGVSPEVIRRVMIAAYEAEMNVVIHSHGGAMKAALDDKMVEVEFTDDGPGIPDIAMAMKEGFSTADAKARQLGFGAGMGLPNIRRNADRFSIESAVGKGTRVCFAVHLKSQEARGVARNSVRANPDKCTACFNCLHACPTRALRIRGNRPLVLDYLCADCTSCIDACPAGALTLLGSVSAAAPSGDAEILVVPPAMLAQFAAMAPVEDVLRALSELGYAEILVTDSAETAVHRAVAEYAAVSELQPVLSPVCQAVMNLIEIRFPSLMRNVAPFLTPMEAAREELAGRRATFVTLCPAQKSLLPQGRGPAKADTIVPSVLGSALLKKLRGCRIEEPGDVPDVEDRKVLRVAGMKHVLRVLDDLENGRMNEKGVLELYACDEGCFGSPLLKEDPYVSRRRWQRATIRPGRNIPAMRREKPLSARPGFRLDSDMARAIEKLAEIDKVLQTLPGQNCGICGCPTCAALAEDVVLNRGQVRCRRMESNR
jgi:anti-sigma regulatory factor (Ser/Thr protein kinase)